MVLKRILLICSLLFNIGLLGYYKYFVFFIEQFNRVLLKFHIPTYNYEKIILPIGISFFTFHAISYVVDVYRGTNKPLKNPFEYALYILMFFQLIAGPIIRFHEISSQLNNRTSTIERFCEGVWRFSIGLGKKVLIADLLGVYVDKIFDTPLSGINLPTAWVGIIFYTFQILFDFSGYSDMAIGLGKMFGFELPENFNRPYISKSITEFWRRWHMSLSRFFKDYIYVPMGGNRCSKVRNYFNLWTVFLLCGLWHGASWTFLIWGAYHGILLVIEKIFTLKKLERLPGFLSNAITLILVIIGWVFFRSNGMTYALGYLKTMFNVFDLFKSTNLLVDLTNKTIISLLFALFISLTNLKVLQQIKSAIMNSMFIKGTISILLLVYSIIVISTGTFNAFIYFQF